MEFVRKILWAVITITLLYIGYQAYVRWWSVGGSLDQKKQIAEQYVAEKKAEVGKKISEKTNEVAGGVVREAKRGVLDYVREKISDGLTSVGEGLLHSAESIVGASSSVPLSPLTVGKITGGDSGQLSAPTALGFATPATPATIATKVNTPVIFSVNRGTSYTVLWGDGASESGTVTSELVQLLSHAWQTAGDFTVKITIKGTSSAQDYSFPIRVYP